MSPDSLSMLLKIIGFAGIVGILAWFLLRKKPADSSPDPALEAKVQEYRIQGLTDEAARSKAAQDYEAVMKQKRKRGSIIIGVVWIAFGLFFLVIIGPDISSFALLGLGLFQLISAFWIKKN